MTTNAGVTSILRERFGLSRWRPLQREIVDRVMTGGDALVVMPTGSGKSLCYQLPALALPGPGTTLVFSPLIALMEDQVAGLKRRGIRAEYINSTVGRRERETRMKRLASGKYELLYATPERMQRPGFTDALRAAPGGIKLLAVDEAHCISRWGHDLRPAYREVGEFRRGLGSPPTIALTATATRAVRRDILRTLGRSQSQMPLFILPLDRPNLSLEVEPVWDDDDKLAAIERLACPGGRARGTGIVYFALIRDLEHLTDELRRRMPRRRLAIYHGQLSPREKKRIYDDFVAARPDDGLLLCATNAFGMGVDKPDIRFIVHAQMPGSVEAYYQEVGRAGRDGRRARCMLLYAADDLAIQQQFTEWANPSADLLVRTARAAEGCPHHDFDLEELQLLVSGRARTDARGLLDYALGALVKRGVVEPTGRIDRYRFVRPLHHAEVDPKAIERKRQRDLRRLLDVVKMCKSDDVAGFVRRYFDAEPADERPTARRGRRKKGAKKGARARPSRGAGRTEMRFTRKKKKKKKK